MSRPLGRPSDESGQSDISALAFLELSPGELVHWMNRPRAVSRLVSQAAPQAFLGLAMITFVVFWMFMVIWGGHNGWDKGKHVPPFAPHNVLIAAVVGLWMIPPSMYVLSWPLRDWQRLSKTSYVVTDRRAIMVESGFFGRTKAHSYDAKSLRLMRVVEYSDGSGDLVFENCSTWTGLTRTFGFLGIDEPRSVETLVRETLYCTKPEGSDEAVGSTAQTVSSTGTWKSYYLSLPTRLFQFVALAAGILSAVCLLADFLLLIGFLLLRPVLSFQFAQQMVQEYGASGVVVGTVIGVGSAIGYVFVLRVFFQFALFYPIELNINDDRVLTFRGRVRKTCVPIDDLVAIRTGGWSDPNRFIGVVRFKQGKQTFVNRFSDFKDFLATVKDQNPTIVFEGF
jgi:hypothetical protein